MSLEDYPIPNTLEEAVLTLELILTKETEDTGIVTWSRMPVDRALAVSHHAIGQDIRNQWLWQEDKPLRAWFIEKHSIWHADDMSSIILACLHHRLNHSPYDLDADVQRFKDYWENQGVTGIPDEARPRSLPEGLHKIANRTKTAAPSRYDLLRKNDG